MTNVRDNSLDQPSTSGIPTQENPYVQLGAPNTFFPYGHYFPLPYGARMVPFSDDVQQSIPRKWPITIESREDIPTSLNNEEEDIVELLDEKEALEFVEFDPSVHAKDTWKPPKSITAFLNRFHMHPQVGRTRV